MKPGLQYLLLIVAVIIAGLFSRGSALVPIWIGDALYALMTYFIVRCIFLQKRPLFVCLLSLGICMAIECSQLLHAGWIDAIRKTLAGRLILGQGFLWSDLVAYTAGAALGHFIDIISRRKLSSHDYLK